MPLLNHSSASLFTKRLVPFFPIVPALSMASTGSIPTATAAAAYPAAPPAPPQPLRGLMLPPDSVYLRELALTSTRAGPDCWHRFNKPQPVTVNVTANRGVLMAGATDALAHSLHYGTLAKTVTGIVTSAAAAAEKTTLAGLAAEVAAGCLQIGAEHVTVDLAATNALLRADAVGVRTVKHAFKNSLSEEQPAEDVVYIKGLKVFAVIGLNPWERLEKQDVVVDIEATAPADAVDAVAVANAVVAAVEPSEYLTIEAMVVALTELVSKQFKPLSVTLSVEKPRAVASAAAAGVRVSRSRRYYSTDARPGEHIAYIGMGSNLGERATLLDAALVELEARGVHVEATSSMYESAPMYVENQPLFMNAVCKVRTKLSPIELLDAIQDVESNALKRVKVVDKGPRTIDLDIELYDDIVMSTPRLTIPHALMLEREFVLRPLVELCPDYVHPVTTHTIAEHFRNLTPAGFVSDLRTVVPVLPSEGKRQLMFDTIHSRFWPTQVMAILNLTPDSFSDGGKHSTDADYILETMRGFVAAGATIVDIGGQSTNPRSTDPGEAVELARILPTIKLIRSHAEFDHVVLSIDTFYASVARACVAAGADMINDVSAGALDPTMLAAMAELNVPVVLMHMRGTPQTMSTLTEYPNGVVADAAAELAARVRAAEAAGVRRWNIVLDPGLGFAKDVAQNVELVRRLGEFRVARPEFEGLPWLLGPSRKRFVGAVTGVTAADERAWGTAAAVVGCVAGGADVVRVHDVTQMAAAVKMADAIYKSN
ncbi:Dihydropteroate synthase-like protein [Dipodascopsis tothii]|uniref:Dihydropteroate synthase-like protein n=1 Tax=Dipodascopsis tothii TaxID=44089 RepID=UPI0034CE3364